VPLTTEAVYVSRYSQPTFGVVTRDVGTVADPEANSVLATLLNSSAVAIFEDEACTRTEEGFYEITLTSNHTSEPDTYEIQFDYVFDSVLQTYSMPFVVGDVAPAYDNLNADAKAGVESVYLRFADFFDSPTGEPHLTVYFQTHFGRGRVSQLMSQALMRLNLISQPQNTYTLDGVAGQAFPWNNYGGLLIQATYVEVIKHLVRSYVEQPDKRNVSVAYLDRRDYMQRWQDVLRTEQADLDKMLEVFKIAHLGLGKPSVLVEGGAFGRSWFYRNGMFMNPARPGGYVRYY
jgi:hypothetical protein